MARVATPRTPEELTPDWLTAALRSRGVIGAATVTAATPQVIGAGVGFLGQLARVALTYDRAEPGAPASLIGKFPTLDPGGRHIGNLFRFYEREIRFYDEVAADVTLRVPRRYYSAMDIEGDEYLLLLEDLDGKRCGDEVAGCTIAAAELALTNLAEFHASWWEKDDSPRLRWMPYSNDPVHQSAQQSYAEAWPAFCEMFGDRMSPPTRKLAEALQPHIIDLLNMFERPPRTIAHGDYRLDNMFFNIADGSQFAVIDWQISTRGRGMFDVAYFISSSLDPEERQAHEERLVRLWYDTVMAHGSPATGYSFDDAWGDYRAGVLYTHIYTVIGIGSLDPANERGMALINKWMNRRLSAMEHLDVGELMPR